MEKHANATGFHDGPMAADFSVIHRSTRQVNFQYEFQNFFHPFPGELMGLVNRAGLAGMLAGQLDPAFRQDFFGSLYAPSVEGLAKVNSFQKSFDVSNDGPYAIYNWELFFHIPLAVAVHLSKTQRFAEAQRWFHFIFDPTANEPAADPSMRFWRFLAFRDEGTRLRIEDIVRILGTNPAELSPEDRKSQEDILDGYLAILNHPFMPHAVARHRSIAYQFHVVMKYLDNLVAWGDHLFLQDTVESINEATQLYVLAASVLGERPQKLPPPGTVRAKSFARLKAEGLGPMGNALVEMEGLFPFNLNSRVVTPGTGGGVDSSPLFGIGRTLYFCLPPNEKLLGYWDTVADRLFKIRHGMNLAGVVRPLALFDPPIDPGMLVKAAAAGIDIGSILSGLTQPAGPVRSLFLIQKALELCGEVRGLGNALLSALEKGDAEHLALIRQRHEIQIAQMAQDVRFLQWKAAQEATSSLLTSRGTVLERLSYYARLLGLPADQNAPETISLDRRALNEENFDEAYATLVGQYGREPALLSLPELKIAGNSSPANRSGMSGQGSLYLNGNEDEELNRLLPEARDTRLSANALSNVASVLTFFPNININLHFWGVGGSSEIFGGKKLSDALKLAADILKTVSAYDQDQAGIAGKTAGYQRRADEWALQYNLAAHDLMQNGRQILTSLIAEQIAYHEYESTRMQIENSREIDRFLHDRFTCEDLHLWMQGEISRIYYEYYRFAVDTARKAERAMKQDLMWPELESQEFVKFNYWDGGRKGLLSGEALHLDVKRMELAYHENNRRELELTKQVSLRQLDPVALLQLKGTGTCRVAVPEWLYDLDTPGHYMRRIRSVAVSIPSVVGPYTGVCCTLSLLGSSLRKSPEAGDDYTRQGAEDPRFLDYAGSVQSVVTSTGQNDSGLFEVNLRDERVLPFEGAGAESTWKLDLPRAYPSFDYGTIPDVILHIRYTARQGVDPTKVTASLDDLFQRGGQSPLALMLDLRNDFPSAWSAFLAGSDFSAPIGREYFPYFTQGKDLALLDGRLFARDPAKHHVLGDAASWDAASASLKDEGRFTLIIPPDPDGPTCVLTRAGDPRVFLVLRYLLL